MEELFWIDTGVLLNILFSIGFILIGSLAFHIATLVSGHDIYRDLPTQESTLLSIVAGIVIFLLTPISFIILQPSTNSANILVQILDFNVLFPFLGSAVGLGLIFGCITILEAREKILAWFRKLSGMRFIISGYGITWDKLLSSVKNGGVVFVQTDNGLFKGFLRSYSRKDEPREILLEKAKIKRRYRRAEGIITGEKTVKLLILGSEIKRIIVPERSFKKHYDSMGHISQAFYCQILAIGFFFLSYSAKLTGNYVQNELNLIIDSLDFFYYVLTLSFLALTVIVLCFSVWLAKQDFDSGWAFLRISPDITFMALFLLLLAILFILYIGQISVQLIVLSFLFLFPFLYISIIRKWLRKPIEDSFDEIKDVFEDDQALEKAIGNCYLKIRCNDKDKASINMSMIKNEIIKLSKNDENKEKIKKLIEKVENLKGTKVFKNTVFEKEYLENEDYNIILAFLNIIEKKS
jgi:hypothetical protein